MRGLQRGIASVCLAVSAILVTGPTIAAEAVIGSVLAVRGAVFTDTGGTLQPLAADAPVRQGDAIVSRNGKARIGLDDGTVVSVGENTRVRIGEYERARTGVKARLALVSGALRLLVAKVAPDGNFEVETETAIAAVRGTEWIIEATAEQTSVALLSGKVAVSGRGGEGGRMTVLLASPGQGTDVRRGAPPTPPIAWGIRRFADVLARATFN